MGDNGINNDGNGSTKQQPQAAATKCVHSSFPDVTNELSCFCLPRASALFADLGCSSMQVNDPSRGFMWKADGSLDMHMDAAIAVTNDGDATRTRTTPPPPTA